MKFESFIGTVNGDTAVTVADYLTGEIYADRETPHSIIHGNDKRFHHFLKSQRIYGISVGSSGDLIVEVLAD